jgi:GT2 family glycosyltransferase
MAAVAIVRNEGSRLARCLQSLLAEGLFVVYVDSTSADDSVATAKRLGVDVHSLTVDLPFTAARARSEGVAALERKGMTPEFVFFIDGDCEVEAGWPSGAQAFLHDNPDFGAVCGRRREREPDASPYNAIMDREWATPIGECDTCGGDAVYRRVAYHAAGGFDPAILAGEEPELCARLLAAGWKVMRLDTPMTNNDAAMTRFSQWWQRAIRSGYVYAQAFMRSGLYSRQIARALPWAGVLPFLSILLGFLVDPGLLLVWPILVCTQFVRLSLRDGVMVAWLAIVGKYAELTGITRFFLGRIASASYR